MRVRAGVIIGILTLTITVSCHASEPGTTAANFLKIGIGAKANAMGEAFTAVADDSTSLYWNPAGLSQLKKRELSAMYNIWFQSIRQGYLSLAFPVAVDETVGVSVNYMDIGSLERRDEECNLIGIFRPSELHISIGYAKRVYQKLAVGLTAGWIEDNIDGNYRKEAFLGNIGLLYSLNRHFTLGVVAQNIGNKVGEDPLPFILKTGIAFKSEALTLSADIAQPKDNDLYWCAGVEWWMRNSIVLRVGYKTNQDIGTGLTAGLGFKTGKVQLDYAYVPYGDLGNAHRISLRMRF